MLPPGWSGGRHAESTWAIFNVADIVPSRFLFSTTALLAAGSNALLLIVPGFESALLARVSTGFFLAGVYPPAMKMISTWFKGGRGLAIGTVVGALTVGKAAPYLLRALPGLSVERDDDAGAAGFELRLDPDATSLVLY